MNLVISSGHGKYVRGASGYLDEVDEARRVVDAVADKLRDAGHQVEVFHDDVSTSQNENLNRIVDFHNAQERDLDVSVHFNAYETTSKPMGCEVLYVTQGDLAEKISANLADAAELPDRGPKYRSDLFFLNNTEQPAILIETCFVDSSVDAESYELNFEDICDAIAESLTGEEIEEGPPIERPPIEPPELSSDNRVDIVGAIRGEVSVIINGQRVAGRARCVNAVVMTISMSGDVTVSINGQDFHNTSPIPDNQRTITASVFGGESDYNVSAYDENKVLDDKEFYVALPDRFEGDRPEVKVYNRATGAFATASIEDVGPWNIDDPYWETGERPQAETCHNQGEPLPDGPNAGKTPSNPAGIDLSPALADAIGIDGMGTVDWEFIK